MLDSLAQLALIVRVRGIRIAAIVEFVVEEHRDRVCRDQPNILWHSDTLPQHIMLSWNSLRHRRPSAARTTIRTQFLSATGSEERDRAMGIIERYVIASPAIPGGVMMPRLHQPACPPTEPTTTKQTRFPWLVSILGAAGIIVSS